MFCRFADEQQYEYGEDLGVTAVALYDYQAGENCQQSQVKSVWIDGLMMQIDNSNTT